MENYFNYFTDIELHFCRRRGSGLQLSPLDWTLMETWKDAGIPLEAVLRGIDATFDHYDRRPPRAKFKKINGLAWCVQEVLTAAEEMKEASVGVAGPETKMIPGMGPDDVTRFLRRNGEILLQAKTQGAVESVARECSAALGEIADGLEATSSQASGPPRLEDLERHLTILEEKILAALTMTASDAELVSLNREADREIGPYRSKMPGFQIEQLKKQFVHKRLLEKAKMPRLSLFYM